MSVGVIEAMPCLVCPSVVCIDPRKVGGDTRVGVRTASGSVGAALARADNAM